MAEKTVDAGALVLVVDDNVMSRRLLEHSLKRNGHTVISVESGREGLNAVAREAFDLIFLDLMLEDMDGRQVLAALKAEERFRDIPVVIVTGLEEADVTAECVAAGASSVLHKPVGLATVTELLNNLLSVDGTKR